MDGDERDPSAREEIARRAVRMTAAGRTEADPGAPAAGRSGAPAFLRSARAAADDPDAAARLARALGPDLALAVVFASPRADFAATMRAAAETFAGAEVLGCTTAGEIAGGYLDEEEIVAVGLPASDFAVEVVAVDDLSAIEASPLIEGMIRARRTLAERRPDFQHEFAFLLVDGTSLREDALMDVLSHGLGPVPLFGGSAGDGTRFRQSLLARGAALRTNAALVAFVRTRCPVKVFSFDHFDAAHQRMVVTRADPIRRRVQEINAAPAAREYARLLGKDPNQLDPLTFAAHPVVVRVGGRYHVRSIQRVEEGDLIFFSAIDEGVVLTLAEPRDIAEALRGDLAELTRGARLDSILACDCLLRRIEAEQKQRTRAVSDVLRENRVVGFSTYGEQFGAMHVNLTITGVAIFHPD